MLTLKATAACTCVRPCGAGRRSIERDVCVCVCLLPDSGRRLLVQPHGCWGAQGTGKQRTIDDAYHEPKLVFGKLVLLEKCFGKLGHHLKDDTLLLSCVHFILATRIDNRSNAITNPPVQHVITSKHVMRSLPYVEPRLNRHNLSSCNISMPAFAFFADTPRLQAA